MPFFFPSWLVEASQRRRGRLVNISRRSPAPNQSPRNAKKRDYVYISGQMIAATRGRFGWQRTSTVRASRLDRDSRQRKESLTASNMAVCSLVVEERCHEEYFGSVDRGGLGCAHFGNGGA